VRTRVLQQAVIADLGLRGLGTASLAELMHEAVERVADTLGVDYCEILELVPDRSGLVLRAGIGWRNGVVGQATVSAGCDSQAGFTLASGEPVIVGDLATETRFAPSARLYEHEVASGMSVVVHSSSGPFGVLAAHTRRHRRFTTDDTHFLQAIANVLATAIDRSRAQDEMRRLEQLARQRERLADLGAIAAQVVHDLGNPVAALSLQAELLLRRMAREDSAVRACLLKPAERVVAEIRRLDKLVSDFKDFARQQRLDLGPIDLRRFLEGLVALWRPVAAARRIQLALDLPPGVPPIVADEGKLHRVLDNLLKNAVEAIDSGPGEIRIAASLPTPERVRISVSDSGAGLAPGAHIFRLFETTKPGGLGLGLAVARQIALAHGGNLEAAPREPRGAVFHLDLPVEAGAAR
jgi:signal transduction histidine kinase